MDIDRVEPTLSPNASGESAMVIGRDGDASTVPADGGAKRASWQRRVAGLAREQFGAES
jgi:hypothetical protein